MTAPGTPPEEEAPPAQAPGLPQAVGSYSAPQTPYTVQVEGDIYDEAVWRRFQAQQTASQTLSLQRAEWYARSTRLHVMWAFYLGLASGLVGLILLAILVAAGNGEDSSSFYDY